MGIIHWNAAEHKCYSLANRGCFQASVLQKPPSAIGFAVPVMRFGKLAWRGSEAGGATVFVMPQVAFSSGTFLAYYAVGWFQACRSKFNFEVTPQRKVLRW